MMPEWIVLTGPVHPIWVRSGKITYFALHPSGATCVQFDGDDENYIVVTETPDEIAMLLGIKQEGE